ncbi:hypothetical protein TBLA_0C04340 [Henningerozyma blattae CBS 6284]|uniref:Uncharacterized protein n=1 Tax=Henningerozyma blattae (strain ATCC 34711 / CBS 6284 / DSM 70876 / NBRC 10599 / NRRL Y-10934 / UCD 77-7) TaxID=1071380 RepID=I2H1I0_HENB6|nr:hypothetical protein TBLA_0C04340 [Tetrapisispora blattae CBS 6284]CCH60232.1 hypothetical protein TBLA_0C04340 [Tetrapisispora blattae CBS 6284]
MLSKKDVISKVYNHISDEQSNNLKKDEIYKFPTARPSSFKYSFKPPQTHNMVISLFDPRLKKSFLECFIVLIIFSNFYFAYILVNNYGRELTRNFFLIQYIIWRLSYNFGIGSILYFQSKNEFLTIFAKKRHLFKSDNTSYLSRFSKFEINSKMPKDYIIENYHHEVYIGF